jgi:hypothetical protein
MCCYVSLLFSAESRLASLNFVHVRQKFPLVQLEHSVPRFPRSRESSPALNTCGTGWHRYCPEMWPSPIARSNQALQSRCTKTFPSTHDFRLPGLLDWRLGKGVFQNLPNYQIWLTSLNMYRLRLQQFQCRYWIRCTLGVPGCLGLVLPQKLASCLAPKLIETDDVQIRFQ